jgi:hypothetical protein
VGFVSSYAVRHLTNEKMEDQNAVMASYFIDAMTAFWSAMTAFWFDMTAFWSAIFTFLKWRS